MKLSLSQKLKIKLILPYLKKADQIIDLGCGNMWLTKYLRARGYNIKGFSLEKPADIVGDIKTYDFKKLKYDVVIALEFVEHVDCYVEIKHILKKGGLLILTTPVPHFDWLCLIMEKIGFFQSRGNTPHSHLIYIKDIPLFKYIYSRTFLVNQFAVFTI